MEGHLFDPEPYHEEVVEQRKPLTKDQFIAFTDQLHDDGRAEEAYQLADRGLYEDDHLLIRAVLNGELTAHEAFLIIQAVDSED